jgi:aspartyl-tRNA(Asn)/glutamyl-tRNA(Gln) amidotransferase subunit A
MKTLAALADDLAAGRTSSRTLVDDCLARIADPAGEGGRAFVKVNQDGARAAADAADGLRRYGAPISPLAGIPVSVKDLLDVAGEVTKAGSRALADRPAATADAPVTHRLRAAGAIIVGRTNMTEFAFSGIGINPHYGTPKSPWDRATGRIPGGSSSGAAVSVADGMAAVAIGTDTGGSCRIPAALCGIVGWKPTARRVPTAGAVALSTTLDSIGPLGASVACCALVDAIIAGEAPEVPTALPLAGLRLGLPRNVVLDALDAHVAPAFEAAVKRLRDAGAVVTEFTMPEFEEIVRSGAQGGFAAAEAWAIHRALIAERGDQFDHRVRARILRGQAISAADYVDLVALRRDIIARADRRTAHFDALVMPTTPRVPPPIADLERDDAVFSDANLAMLRNTALFNFLDRCSISLPCNRPGEAPVGLMLVGETMADRRLFALARAVEAAMPAAAAA